MVGKVKEMKKIIKGDCPYGVIDFDDFKEDCAFHTHDIIIERVDNKRRNG